MSGYQASWVFLQQHQIYGWLFCSWNGHFSWLPYKIHLLGFSLRASHSLCILFFVLLALSCHGSLRFFYSGIVPLLSLTLMRFSLVIQYLQIELQLLPRAPVGSGSRSPLRFLTGTQLCQVPKPRVLLHSTFDWQVHLLSHSSFSPLFFLTLE